MEPETVNRASLTRDPHADGAAPGRRLRRGGEGAANMMDALIRRDAMTSEQAVAVGARIALFHRDAGSRPEGTDYRELVDRNFEALLPLIESLIPARERLALQRFAAAFLLGWAAVLEARATAGSVVEGHGNLWAANVLFEREDVLLVNRLELDALRVVDVADDLGSLLMDLGELTGAQDVGNAVLTGYHDAGGRAQPEALMAFFGAYRAQVGASVALRAPRSRSDPQAQVAHARRLLALSSRLAWRARGPLLLLVTGPSVAGKSTLARALGRISGLPVLSPDTVRPEPGGKQPDQGLTETPKAYADLARRAGSQRAAIVDAAFGEVTLQQAFTKQLASGDATRPLVVECRAPADVRAARARRRRRRDPDAHPPSPGTREQAERFVATRGIASDGHLAVDTRAPLSMQVDEVASWLDSLMATGRSA